MSVAFDEEVTTKLKPPAKFNIWAINNDLTAFDEVVFILTRAFGMSESVASEITFKVDREGKAKCNPKPMSRGLAEAQLAKVNGVKKQLASMYPFRSVQIMMLQFVIKED